MAENTATGTTPLVEEEFNDDTFLAWEESQKRGPTPAQLLPALFNTPEELAAFTRSTQLPEYKIPLDTVGLLTQYPKGTSPARIMSDAAQYVTSTYKYKDDQGVTRSLQPGTYEAWLKTRNPNTKQNWTDREIVSTLANVRDLTGIEEFGEGVFTDSISGAGFTLGATWGGRATRSPWGALAGGLVMSVMTDSARRKLFPSTDIPVLEPTGAGTAGRITGGSLAALPAPWLINGPVDLSNDWLTRNIRRMPFIGQKTSNRIADLPTKLSGYINEGLAAARNNPIPYLLTETRAIGTSAGAGAAMTEWLPGDQGASDTALSFGLEALLPVADPVGWAARGLLKIAPAIKGSIATNLSLAGRQRSAAQRYSAIITGANGDPTQISLMLRAQFIEPDSPDMSVGERAIWDAISEENKDYLRFLQASQIAPADRTSAIQTGLPVLWALESTGLPAILQARGVTPDGVIDPEIGRRHQNAYGLMDKMMQSLLDEGSPEALRMFAQVRALSYQQELGRVFENGYKTFANYAETAFATGESFDSGLAFHRIFFGADGFGGIAGDVEKQATILRDAIPPDIIIPEAALNNGLVKAWVGVREKMDIRGKPPRISSGGDLWNLNAIIKDFDKFANPEKYAEEAGEDAVKAILPVGPFREGSTGTVAGFPDRAPAPTQTTPEPEPEPVTSREVVTFLGALSQAKSKASADGNKDLLYVLNELEMGAVKTLEEVSKKTDGVPAEGSVAARLSNYTSFKREANRVFSQSFLGQDLAGYDPRLVSEVLFQSLGNPALSKQVALNEAFNFLSSTNKWNTPLQEPFLLQNASLYMEPQEKMLRSILGHRPFFNRVIARDPSTGEIQMEVDNTGEISWFGGNSDTKMKPVTRLEPTPAFIEFMENPENKRLMLGYFPDLYAQLQDVNEANAAFKNLQNPTFEANIQLNNKTALMEKMSRRYENPSATIYEIIGTPETRATRGLNPMRDFTALAQEVVQSGDEAAIQGLFDAALNAGYDYADGTHVVLNANGSQATSTDKLMHYFNDPIKASGGLSFFDILVSTGVIKNQQQAMGFQRTLSEMHKVSLATIPGRARELGLPGDQDALNETMATLQAGGVRAFGAGIASSIYGMLSATFPNIIGNKGSLVAAAVGAQAADKLARSGPAQTAKFLFTSLEKDPLLLGRIMAAEAAEAAGEKIPREFLRPLFTWLYGAGIVPAAMEYREFSDNYYGNTAPEQREVERAAAGAPRGRDVFAGRGAPNPRRVAPGTVPPAQPLPPPLASVQAPRPMAQPQRQAAPAPRPQAPQGVGIASLPQGGQPSVDQRMQQLFPFDTLSSGGIGSLG